MKCPEIQRQIQDQLDHLIGRECLPTIQDVESLPLLQATVYEVLRISSIIPLAIPRSTTTTIRICNFKIPIDTIVIVNLWSVLHDPKAWKDPDVFNPKRFLDGQGQLIDLKFLGGFCHSRGVAESALGKLWPWSQSLIS